MRLALRPALAIFLTLFLTGLSASAGTLTDTINSRNPTGFASRSTSRSLRKSSAHDTPVASIALPSINLVKLTNGTDNNSGTGVIVPVGSTVTFTYIVTNNGTEPLSSIFVRDDNGTPGDPSDEFIPTFIGGDANANGVLETSETWTFTANRIATPGQYSNTGTAFGTPYPGGGSPVLDTDVDHHFGSAPGVNLTKLTNGTDNNSAPGAIVPVGSTVTFTYIVTNTGNVPLSGVTVKDDNGTPGNTGDDFNAIFVGGDSNGNGLLDTSETWTFTSSRFASPGQYTNTGTATGTPPPGGGAQVTDSDVDNHFGGTIESTKAWTTAGSAGATEDESNPARPTYTNFTAAANPGSPAGAYILRYNIQATDALSAPGANTRLRVRFRDEGAGSRVTVAIVRSPIAGGSPPTAIGTLFDSDAFAPSSGFQTQQITFPAVTFDFAQYIYFLEVTLTKADAANQPGFASAQINQQ